MKKRVLGVGKMKITDIRIRVLEDAGKLKAVVSITIDDCFVVHDLKVVEGSKGIFVMMPGKKMPDGQFKDLAHPTDGETRDYLQKTVLDAYEKAVSEKQ